MLLWQAKHIPAIEHVAVSLHATYESNKSGSQKVLLVADYESEVVKTLSVIAFMGARITLNNLTKHQ